MRIQEKQKALEQEVIANLCAIPKMPENMLPHTVYVEEEGEDGYGHGIPVYTMYRLEEIRTDGSFLHSHCTCIHKFQSIFKTQCTGSNQCRELTK